MVFQAALASGTFGVICRALSILLSIAIARVLGPVDAGILGLAVVLVEICSQISYSAETACVTGRSAGSDRQYAIAAVVLRGALTVFIACGILIWLPHFSRLLGGMEQNSEKLARLARLLMWQLVIEVASAYPRVLLQRHLRLVSMAVANLVGVAVHVGFAAVLLLQGYGAAGVVLASIVGTGIGGIYVWSRLTRDEWRWQGRIEASLWRETGSSTAKVLSGGILGFVNGRVDNLLVAGALGPAAMSFYSMSWNLSRIPAGILNQVVSSTVIPMVAKVREDRASVERMAEVSLRYSYAALVPVAALLFVCVPSLVEVALGPQWLPLVPGFRVMAITILMGPLVATISAILYGTGLAHIATIATGAQLLALCAFMVPLALRWGVVGAALGDFIGVTVLTVLLCACASRAARFGEFGRWSAVLPPLIAGACAAALGSYVGSYLEYGTSRVVVESIVVLPVYVVLACLLGGRTTVQTLIGLARGPQRTSLNGAIAK